MLRYGSLCSGIGGLDLGFERAGMKCVWQVEKDEFCRQVLTKHWPDIPKFEDIYDVGKHNLESVDLIVTGFPCQPHSHAGKRKGAADDRDLWPENRRIIGELRPTWVVIENVPGIKTTILDQVLLDLENLLYATETLIIPACGVNAPHRRDRVFVVAHADSINRRPRTRRENRAQVGHQSSSVVFSEGLRLQGNGGTRKQVTTARQPEEEFEGGQPAMAYPNGYGCTQVEQQNGSGTSGKGAVCTPKQSSGRGEWRPTESGLGGTLDGIPARMDGYWDRDWERNTPRVKVDVPNRKQRLKALGNAVVPQVAEWIGSQIVGVEEYKAASYSH